MSIPSLKALVESSDLTYTGHCKHKHELNGSGAIFFQSLGFLRCGKCKKYQAIKKPLK
jgi:hypothetical protein